MDLPWTDILDASEKIATILAILFAGIAAYYKFLRGRVFYPRMEVVMSAALLPVAKQQFLKVTATVKNTGASIIPFYLEDSILEISGGDHSYRQIADSTVWKKLATVSFTDKHKWIEPAETIQVLWLIDLPTNSTYSALKSELTIAGEKSYWKADTIIEREPRIVSERGKEHHVEDTKG